jgi:hypothetical protein
MWGFPKMYILPYFERKEFDAIFPGGAAAPFGSCFQFQLEFWAISYANTCETLKVLTDTL